MRRKAFVWWRMLIGLALISLAGLAVVFWPVSGRGGGENPHRSACQSNLKLIGLAIKTYMQDYNDVYPPISSGTRGWKDVIQPYMESEQQFFQCPAETSGKNSGTTDYFYNSRVAGQREEQFEYISNTIMNGDGLGDSPRNASLSQLPQSWASDAKSPAWRHLEGANYLYGDGHVKWIKPDKVSHDKPSSSISTFAPW